MREDWRAALSDAPVPRGRQPAPPSVSPWGETETGGPPVSASGAPTAAGRLGGPIGGPALAAAAAGGALATAPARPAPSLDPQRATVDINRIAERWDELVDAVRTDKPMLAAALQHATPVSVTARGEVLVQLDQPNDMMARAFTNGTPQLLEMLQGWFAGITKLQLRTGDAAAAAPARRLTEQEVRRDQLAVLRRKDPVLAAAIDALDLDLVE